MTQYEGSYGSRPRATPGTRLNGIYEIERLIATGGMGEIYKGHAIQTGDPVAIKMIRSDLAENDAALALFKKEASALHNLYNEAIVRYFVFSIDPILGCPYLAMEYVEGPSLSDVLQRGSLGFDQVRVLQKRLADGLQAAHEVGIIHRDVSPDNVILPGGNVSRAKIIDFGIARSPIGDGTVIGSGFAGKFNYVSPEQLGLFGGDVTAKSDIYSLGLVLAQALLGRPLDMGGSQVQVIDKRRRVPDLSEIDSRIRPLISRMLQPDPADRPESMADIAAWQVGLPGRASASPKQRKRRRWGLLAGGIATAALLAGIGVAAGPTLWRVWSERFPADGAAAARRGDVPSLAEGAAPDRQIATVSADQSPTLIGRAQPSQSPQANIDAPSLVPVVRERRPDSMPSSVLMRDRPVDPPADADPPAPAFRPSESPASDSPRVASREPPPIRPEEPGPSEPAPRAQASPDLPPSRRGSPQLFGGEKTIPQGPGRADFVARYVTDYNGGTCFFATPVRVTDNSATIDAYGASPAPFQSFDEAFQKAVGFEAQIGLRKISPLQCPVASFLAQVGSQAVSQGGPAPKLQINDFTLRSGQFLTGSVERLGTNHVEILLVADDGYVHNLSRFTKRDGDKLQFNLKIEGAPGSAPKPQILLAVASQKPLGILALREPMPADKLFPAILDEASRTGQSVGTSVKYFKLEG